MEIVWSLTARKSFDRLITFLEKKWEPKVITKLFSELEISLKLIGETPYIFPLSSQKTQIRKCIIRKRTILLYRVHSDANEIELVLFIDARANPLKYKF